MRYQRFFIWLGLSGLMLWGLILPGWACVWDDDTLEMERQAFPEAMELIAGKFLRHSPEFYRWRLQDRQTRLKKDPQNLALYDDLAVAYEKLGQTDKAIDIMLKKDALVPGQYTTYANLGTFYLHDKQFKQGIATIEKALEINPDAHFGREKYQRYLAQYILAREGQLPLGLGPDGDNFVMFLETAGESDWKAAIKGVLGMMYFGNYTSPYLLEALGDLLHQEEHHHLAARAYLKASYEVEDVEIADQYYRFTFYTLGTQSNMHVEKLGPILKSEIAEADAWFQGLVAQEKAWIEQGLNPETEFKRVYYRNPKFANTEPWPYWVLLGILTVGLLCLCIVGYKLQGQRKRKITSSNA